MSGDENGHEGVRQFPFEGLHVYQRAQDAWAVARAAGDLDPLAAAAEREIGEAVLGIARATALSRSNGAFPAALERARGSIHAAAAALEQAARDGVEVDETLRTLLHDGSRMLGALIRSVRQPRGEHAEPVEAEVAV